MGGSSSKGETWQGCFGLGCGCLTFVLTAVGVLMTVAVALAAG